jgi:hypothetical protein
MNLGRVCKLSLRGAEGDAAISFCLGLLRFDRNDRRVCTHALIISRETIKKALITAFLLSIFSSVCFAEDLLSVSGSLVLSGVMPLQSTDTEPEYPGLLGKLKVDTTPPNWRFHMWLEGGWDGTVDLQMENYSVVKVWNKVYQSTTPFMEFKEFYGAYSNDLLELRAGIQRFSWGRLDEYPINDLLNPCDYTQFLLKRLEDRKIGVPSISTRLYKNDWNI